MGKNGKTGIPGEHAARVGGKTREGGVAGISSYKEGDLQLGIDSEKKKGPDL